MNYSGIFQENAYEDVIYKISAILFRPQGIVTSRLKVVNSLWPSEPIFAS